MRAMRDGWGGAQGLGRRWSALLAAALVAAGTARAQTTWTVNTVLDQADVNPGDGICDCDPAPGDQCSLRAALQEACAGGGWQRIVLGPQVFVLSVFGTDDDSRHGDLDVFGGVLTRLELFGGGAGATVIDASGLQAAGGPERVLHVTAGTSPVLVVELRDLTLRSGRQPGRGGGILHEGGYQLALVGVDLVGNQAHEGGGLWSDRRVSLSGGTVASNDTSLSPIGDGGGIFLEAGASLDADGVQLAGNGATRQGGGVDLELGSAATLIGCALSANGAVDGGALYSSGTLVLEGCALSDNVAAPGNGGGVGTNRGSVSARRTRFERNSATSGGALQIAGLASLELDECALVGNRALNSFGGGVAAFGTTRAVATSILFNEATGSGGAGVYAFASLELLNSTISANRAPNGTGGGLYLTGPAPKSISACTIAHNLATSGAGLRSDAPWSVIGTLIANNSDLLGNPANFAGPSLGLSAGRNLDTDGTCAFPAGGCDLSGTLASPIDARLEPPLLNGGFGETQALLPDSPALHRGASFDLAGNPLGVDQRGVPRSPAPDVGAFEGTPETGSFCDATDGALAACPCANPGLADTGCDNAQATGGVRIELTDLSCAPVQVTVTASGFPPASAPTAILFRSNSLQAAPVAFGDGLRCVGVVGLVRLAATTASGGVATHVFGHAALPGVFYYQDWYRNTPASYCSPLGFNLSNGLTIVHR